MSGFLHRLAARSLQAAPTVHAAARLPYARFAEDAPAAPDLVPLASPSAAAPDASPASSRAVDARGDEVHPAPPVAAAPRERRPDPPAAVTVAAVSDPHPHPSVPRRAEDAPAAPPVERIYVPLVPPSSTVPAAAHAPAGQAPAGEGPAAQDDADPSPPRTLRPGGEVRAARAEAPPAEAFAPAPRLPRAVVERVAAAAREAEEGGAAVVEVNIGRIVVAAPPPPPPAPRRAAEPGHRPMSLSEYLERRGRGR